MRNKLMKFQFFIPIIFIVLLLGLLVDELYSTRSNSMPSSFKAQSTNTPQFNLPDLFQPNKSFTPSNFRGRVVLLNIWASWCDACFQEHKVLLAIKNKYHVPIFGIDYKDSPQVAMKLLNRNGNPYEQVGSDPDGSAAIELGIYGTPETFIIDKHGKIVYRHIGEVTHAIWEEVLYPIVQQYQHE